MGARTISVSGRSRLFSARSGTYTVTDAGTVIDWPLSTGSSTPFATIEVDVDKDNADLFIRSGLANLAPGDVLTESQEPTAHDRRIKAGDVIANIAREQGTPIADGGHSKIGLRCKAGETAVVTINPGA